MSAGPSPLGPSSSIDLTEESQDARGGQLVPGNKARSAPRALPPVALDQPPPRPMFGPSPSSPFPPTLMDSTTSFVPDDIEITGAKPASPPDTPSQKLNSAASQQYTHPMRTSTTTVFNPSQPPYAFPSMYGQGWPSSVPSAGPSTKTPRHIGINGLGMKGNGCGISASSAIDLTTTRIPSPSPVSDQRPVCIGSLQSRAIMLYPCAAAVVGQQPPEGSKERYQTIIYRDAELLRVKLKLRRVGTSEGSKDVIQVLTPGMSSYIGDLDVHVADILSNPIARGLLRLEGFIQRLQPEAHQYEVRINVLLFTLPSNITYIAQALIANSLFLLDPVPPYDPSRHSDRPPYQNAHGGHDMALRLMMLSQRGPRLAGMASDSMTSGQMDKAKQVEVQKQQVDEVFKSLDNGGELEQSDPGLLINTELFPHQRRALTFMLQREQDSSALKTARKLADKKLKKGRASREETVEGSIEGEVESQKGKEKDRSRSL